MSEQWRPVPGYEARYCVSDQGNVLSTSYMRTGQPRLMRPNLSRGYPCVELQTGSVKKRFTVHRLVMLAFVGARPSGMQINHVDGVKSNNALCNLEYCTASNNQKHSFEIGLQCNKGERHSQAKLSDKKIFDIRSALRSGEKQASIARRFGVTPSCISRVNSGTRWPHLAFSEKVG